MPFQFKTAADLLVSSAFLPVIHLGSSPNKLYELLQTKAARFTSIDYIYLVDDRNHLRGVLSIREFFKNRHHAGFKKFFKRPLISVLPDTPQEQVAFLSLHNNLKSIPVTDTHGKFLGAVVYSSLMQILQHEGVENLFSISGIVKSSQDDLTKGTIWFSLKHRLPWLLLGLLGGLLTAKIVAGYEDELSQNLILATFIPLVTYMADAVGTQMEALIIRDLALNSHLPFFKYFFHQLFVVSIIGLITGLLVLGLGSLIYHDIKISLALAIALFAAILSSLLSGLAIPYTFHKLNQDPADASGPIATIIQDAMSVYIYFLIASYILN